jgi:hypothetical protein
LDETQQIIAADLNEFTRFFDLQPAEHAPAKHDADLAGELARHNDRQRPFDATGRLRELQLPRLDDEDPIVLLAGIKKNLTRPDSAIVSVRRDASYLCRCQDREGLVDARRWVKRGWRNCVGYGVAPSSE